jgi:4-amino-4-deoxy-L-arabinose transferase-like glycosyltransferase
MDQHDGPFYYNLAALPVMFAPWSAFMLAVLWYGVRGSFRPNPLATIPKREGDEGAGEVSRETRAHRFLLCWFAAYFVVFSAAATKLPNYIFPLYPALAILTARFLTGWRDGILAAPNWVMAVGTGALALIGAVTIVGIILADERFPGLAVWAMAGLVPLASAIAMARALRRADRARMVTAMAVGSVLFVGVLVAFPSDVVDRYKAPRELVRASGAGDPTRDLRLASFDWFQPSVVYYTGREVKQLDSPAAAAAFLEVPTPAYLFVPEPVWMASLAGRVATPHRVVARHQDFLEKCDILVITNEMRDVASR